ncbi:hypothetical protein LX36DRAFT_662190 [Colletotrichum falcatum]|nr:hypothetical protein LX36DRAFT_662190 [Colletotrichum falcatum]
MAVRLLLLLLILPPLPSFRPGPPCQDRVFEKGLFFFFSLVFLSFVFVFAFP